MIFEFSKLFKRFSSVSKKWIIANSKITVFPDPVGEDTMTDLSSL